MTKTLYVGNLPHEATADSLRELFATDGREVQCVKLATYSKTGKSRGFGFVEMTTEENAEAAMAALQGTVLEGREIKIGPAKDRKSEHTRQYENEDLGRPPGSGGGKRRGRG